MWGIIPAAGAGSRMQPLAFSKELLPVGSRVEGGLERPRAVSEYLVERMALAGAANICFVISPGKSDILGYFGGEAHGAGICYAVQPRPLGLCDSIFRALPLVPPDDFAFVGLPDTVWFPEDGLGCLGDGPLSFLLFPVERPEFFDAVVTDVAGRVRSIEVKKMDAPTNWIWGAFKARGSALRELRMLWERRGRSDEFIGTLVNAYIDGGGAVFGLRAGSSYVDVGTPQGYRDAIALLSREAGANGQKG